MKEIKRGNTTIRLSEESCVRTPEEVEAILARIAEQVQQILVQQDT